LIEEREQQQKQQKRNQGEPCKEEEEKRIEMQLLQRKENRYYADIISLN
jgi:hypothetical protein